MTESMQSGKQPGLADLLARFLERQASAHAAGLATADAAGEVVPYEAVPARPVEPRLAWTEAQAAIRCFQPRALPATQPFPDDWTAIVAGHEPSAAVAFAAGNFPQLVRDVHSLLKAKDLAGLCPTTTRPVAAPALAEWASQIAQKRQFPDVLLALGICRLAKQFDLAEKLLRCHPGPVPSEWEAAWHNEEAALAWHRGQADRAEGLWHEQAGSAPVHFNRGMAALFRNRPKDARSWLTQAVSQLSEDDGWHHLGKLYLALAEMRG